MSSIEYGDSDFDVDLMLADFIVKHHGHKIEPGGIHEDNGCVIDWINNAKKIVQEKK
jgi:hypothetical protein